MTPYAYAFDLGVVILFRRNAIIRRSLPFVLPPGGTLRPLGELLAIEHEIDAKTDHAPPCGPFGITDFNRESMQSPAGK